MEPVRRTKLYEDVLDRLTGAISRGEFQPGSQLPSERELMASLGVGRPAVREAMLALQQMGLVKISHGERARVVRPSAEAMVDRMSAAMGVLLATSPQGMGDLKEARLMMEVGLVRVAVGRASAPDIERLAADLDAMREAMGRTDRFIEADMAFHGTIASISGNALIAAGVRGILGWLSRFKADMVSVRGAEELTIREHARILRAVERGDPDGAARAMSDHILRANALYSQLSEP